MITMTIEVEELGDLASYNIPFGDHSFSPAICKTKNDGFSIRILKSSMNYGHRKEWSYFVVDKNGLIIESPYGMGRMYNRKIIVNNIQAKYEEYKEKRINHSI